jgi:hypothetical protein
MSVHDTGHRYDLRCRRCDRVTAYYSAIDKWEDFVEYCHTTKNEPVFCKCEACGRKTFQDLVSFYMVDAGTRSAKSLE